MQSVLCSVLSCPYFIRYTVYLPDEHVAAFVVIFCVVIRFYVCGSVI